jgi:hypothetical protein
MFDFLNQFPKVPSVEVHLKQYFLPQENLPLKTFIGLQINRPLVLYEGYSSFADCWIKM